MDIFSSLFDRLDPGPRSILEDLERMASEMSGVPRHRMGSDPFGIGSLPKITFTDGDRLEAAKAARDRSTQIRETKSFSCAGCGSRLMTAGNATHCQCPQPKCGVNNELYDISAPIGSVDAYETKARVVPTHHKRHTGGKTTDNDDIIDIAYEEV